MLIDSKVGLVSYGAYLPSLAIKAKEIEEAHHHQEETSMSLGVSQKTVPDIDEDTTTMSVLAAKQALDRLSPSALNEIGCLFIGSESHPYAVKPTGTVVSSALGLSEKLATADLQFACKAGTQSLQIGLAYVLSKLIPMSMAIGADTAQSKPGDVLEFTAGAGAAAMVVGAEDIIARILATTSLATNTTDFWRRPGQKHPEHAGRFTGEPAYFYHVLTASQHLLETTGLTPKDIDYCVFHTPNAKFPRLVAKKLGFTSAQLEPSLVVSKIGNTYAGASLLALSAVLDQAKAGQKILMVSYGSGAGSDAFLLETTDLLVKKRKSWTNLLEQQISQLQTISYQDYRRNID